MSMVGDSNAATPGGRMAAQRGRRGPAAERGARASNVTIRRQEPCPALLSPSILPPAHWIAGGEALEVPPLWWRRPQIVG